MAELAGKELEEAHEQKRALGDGQAKADAEIASKAEAERLMREKYEAAAAKLAACQEALGKFDAECRRIAERKEALTQLKEDGQVELSRIEQAQQQGGRAPSHGDVPPEDAAARAARLADLDRQYRQGAGLARSWCADRGGCVATPRVCFEHARARLQRCRCASALA